MKPKTRNFAASLSFALVFFMASATWAEMDIGDYTISGSAEVDGLPQKFSGNKSEFETYRDVPETVVVPQIDLRIEGKKRNLFLDFSAGQVGLDDQSYQLRFGQHGLVNVELGWDQIPHVMNVDNASTAYVMSGGTYTLRSRPAADDAATFSSWINAPGTTASVDLKLLDKIGRIGINFTPTESLTFTGKYWHESTDGKRAISFPFGTGSSSNIAGLAEPLDYQTNNVEVGGEYAGDGWTAALKYNGSFFHNSISTLVFDNPAAVGPVCADAATIDYATGTGPCRGRADLYPDNYSNTFTLTGTYQLPFKTHFLGTASYGWRGQNDSFLPFTINSAIAEPTLSRSSLDGDVRPTMVNLTLVSNFFRHVNLKSYFRYYDLDNRTHSVSTTSTVRNDQGAAGTTDDWTTAHFYSYSTYSAGIGASSRLARWITGKLSFSWDRANRSIPELEFSNTNLHTEEYKTGPTIDMTPFSWLLFRASYQHSWRFDPGYHSASNPDRTNDFQMFWLTKRTQHKANFFTNVSPWETLSLHFGFDYVRNDYPDVDFRLQSDHDYSPSMGFIYAPVGWIQFFGDYNYDRYHWHQRYNDNITSTGKDKVNTFTLGSDVDLIKDVLKFHTQFGFSQGSSKIVNKGTGSQNWPASTNTWYELLTRLEYQVHKNVALQVGYYFNKYHSKDYGIDIMKLWMGDLDTNSGQIRSIYLGDRYKGGYIAHVALLGVKFKF